VPKTDPPGHLPFLLACWHLLASASCPQDYFDRIGLFSKSFTQSIWLSFGAMRWLLLVAIGLGAGLVSWLRFFQA